MMIATLAQITCFINGYKPPKINWNEKLFSITTGQDKFFLPHAYRMQNVNLEYIVSIRITQVMTSSFIFVPLQCALRCGGLTVSVLASRLSGPRSSIACKIKSLLVVLMGKTIYSHSASLQVYKWIPANLMLAGNQAMD